MWHIVGKSWSSSIYSSANWVDYIQLNRKSVAIILDGSRVHDLIKPSHLLNRRIKAQQSGGRLNQALHHPTIFCVFFSFAVCDSFSFSLSLSLSLHLSFFASQHHQRVSVVSILPLDPSRPPNESGATEHTTGGDGTRRGGAGEGGVQPTVQPSLASQSINPWPIKSGRWRPTVRTRGAGAARRRRRRRHCQWRQVRNAPEAERPPTKK